MDHKATIPRPLKAWENANPGYQITTRRRKRELPESSADRSARSRSPNKADIETQESKNDDVARQAGNDKDVDGNPENDDFPRRTTGLGKGKTWNPPPRRTQSRWSLVKARGRTDSAAGTEEMTTSNDVQVQKDSGVTDLHQSATLDSFISAPEDIRKTSHEAISKHVSTRTGKQPCAELTETYGSSFEAVNEHQIVTASAPGRSKNNLQQDYESDSASDRVGRALTDKEIIEKLKKEVDRLQRDNDGCDYAKDVLLTENEWLHHMIEIAYKGVIFPTAAEKEDMFSALPAAFHDALADVQIFFPKGSHISLTEFGQWPAFYTKRLFQITLLKKIEILESSVHGLSLNTFLCTVSELVPLINNNFPGVSSINLVPIRRGVIQAWCLLMWIVGICTAVAKRAASSDNMFHLQPYPCSWTADGFAALTRLDACMLQLADMKLGLAPADQLGTNLVRRRYIDGPEWIRPDLATLDSYAHVVQQNHQPPPPHLLRSGGTGFLDETRANMRHFLGHAAEQVDRGRKHAELSAMAKAKAKAKAWAEGEGEKSNERKHEE